jgi:hypothetical protein
MKRSVLAFAIAGAIMLAQPQPASANGGDFKLDFIAAAPFTYDHTTGGGAFDNRTIGKANDVVESLEGGDFACGDLVTHFVQISVTNPAAAQQNIRMTFKWTADSTGQSGAAYDQMHNPKINTGVIDGGQGEGPGGTDSGNAEVGTAASIVGFTPNPQGTDGTLHDKGAEHSASVDVAGLNGGDKVILRFELDIHCNGQDPTGNLQATLASASVIAGGTGAIGSGAQTIPLKRVGDIKPCDPKTCPPKP